MDGGKKTAMTSMITSEAVNRAMDYILEHLKEDLSLGQVADHCHFSKYYCLYTGVKTLAF